MALSYEGRHSDGRTAARRDVRVGFSGDELVIRGADDTPVASWKLDDLRLAGEVYRNQPVQLTSAADPDARLSVDDPGFRTPLFACARHLRARRGPFGDRPWLRATVWGVGAAAFVAALIVVLPMLAEPVAALMPVEWESALGEQAVADFLDEAPECAGAAGRRALGRLTGRLAAAVATPYGFTVRVAEVDEVNAFAAPGGQIVIFRGLLGVAGSPDEVAGVLAHEMGHVVERHPTEAIVRAIGLSLVFELLVGDASGLVGLGAGIGEALLGLSYSRTDEAEADAAAVVMLGAAGIRADGLARFLARLEEQHGDIPQALAFLSTHPPGRERAEAVRATAGAGGPAMPPAEWRALASICD